MSSKSAAQEIVEYEKRVRTDELKRVWSRQHREATNDETPDALLMAKERGAESDSESAALWRVRADTTTRLFQYIAAEGPHPGNVMRRVYAVGLHPDIMLEPFANLDSCERELILDASDEGRIFRLRQIGVDVNVLASALNRVAWVTGAGRRVTLDSIFASDSPEQAEVRRDTVARLFEFFVRGGASPKAILRRVYNVGAHMGISPFSDLTVRDRGELLGDSHGNEHHQMNQTCVEPLRRKGARSWKAPGQKSLKSRGGYSRCQVGNSNRSNKRKRKTK